MIKTRIFGICIAARAVVSGCATHGTNLAKTGAVTIDRVAADRFFVPWVDAYQDVNELVLTGVVKQTCQSVSSLKTHVDITILDDKGQVLQQAITKEMHVPPKRPGKGIAWVRFELTLPVIVPEKAVIQVVCHSGEHG
jgi:hypothetical protein